MMMMMMLFHDVFRLSNATYSVGSVAQRFDVIDDATFLRQRRRQQATSQSVAGDEIRHEDD